MQEKVNGVYQPLYPQTYWQQVIGADAQIATVNNRITTVQANLQGQINNKQDTATAVNQGNFKDFVNIVSGYYVGNGEETRTITLGFTPIAVYVVQEYGYTFDGYPSYSPRSVYFYGGLAVTNSPCIVPPITYSSTTFNHDMVTITTNGFIVYFANIHDTSSYNYADTNGQNIKYNYIVFKQ